MDANAVLPKRRLNFSVAMKQQAIAWINGPGLGSRERAVAHFRGLNWEVSSETMDKWWRQRDKIMVGAPTTALDAANAHLDKPRWALLSAPQETALASVIRRRARKVRVSAKWIALAVRQMYPETTPPSFSVSPTWLLGFAQRHGLALVGTTVVASHSTDHHQPQSHSRLRAASAPAAASSAAKSQSVRTMSLHDVLYEEKPMAATIAA